MTRNLCFVVLIAAAAISLCSCSDTQSTAQTENNTGVSTIPWNRPEKWETGSNLPGGLTGSR